MVGIGYDIGFRVHNGFPNALGALGLAVFFGISFSWVPAFIGISVREVEAIRLRACRHHAGSLGDLGRHISRNRYRRRHACVGLGEPLALGWMAGIIVVFSALAVLRYRGITLN